MSFSRFFGLGIILWLLLAVLKSVFLNIFSLSSVGPQVVYGILVFVLALTCSRRLGVINFLEGASVAIVWTIGTLFADWVILRLVLGMAVFSHGAFWLGYIIILVAVFFGHKKRHIQIRQEMEAHSKHGNH